jgi:GTP-binding protein LepA
LQLTGAIDPRKMMEQVLDRMDLERERGITIKLQAVRLKYTAEDGETYELNLIDTPGHVDFTYEVSRSLGACEGALLLVDAVQGVEAQTVANLYLAVDNNLEIIPVINKIDLPSARIDEVKQEIVQILGSKPEEILLVSAKDGTGVPAALEAIVRKIPPPSGDPDAPLQALIFDSHYDAFRGVVSYVRVVNGTLKPRDHIVMMSTGNKFEVDEVGYFAPDLTKMDMLTAGEVGYLMANVRVVADAHVGDTVTSASRPAPHPLPGYKHVKPLVFCGLYTSEGEEFNKLRSSLEKLALNDSSLAFEQESSVALGFGFRCGFLGLLHMEIVQERLEREYALDLIATSPSVVYRVVMKDGSDVVIDNPSRLPDLTKVDHIEEPYVDGTVLTPAKFMGAIMDYIKSRRGEVTNIEYLSSNRVNVSLTVPLSEILYEFHDSLKSLSHGYASFDYAFSGYRPSHLVKVDVLVMNEPVDALSFICHRDDAFFKGRQIVTKLRKTIPRHLFSVPIQAAIGGKVIARETIAPTRKDVLAKCYGGDITRKRKLLEKQKKGKQRMRLVGRVEIPQEAFLAVLRLDREK